MSISETDSRRIDAQLKSAWLQQLLLEFEDICFQYRIKLRPPVFELTDSETVLGSWTGSCRLISLSAHLVCNRPWSVVLQVLKHEIAHQICMEIFFESKTGHGREFRRACSMVGLNGPFCRATADCSGLPAETADDCAAASGQGRKILAKVEKLLALAASDNEHEAALAMQRAGKLLVRHNLKLLSGEERNYEHRTLATNRQRMPGYIRQICSLLQDFFLVRVVCASTYEPMRDRELRTIELFGRPENVAVAAHCYFFLIERLPALWKDNKHQFAHRGTRARNSYFRGLLTGFREKLTASFSHGEQDLAFAGQQRSLDQLIVVEDTSLDVFVRTRFPRLRAGRRQKTFLQLDAYRQAVTTGRSLVLHRVVKGSAPDGGLLGFGVDS